MATRSMPLAVVAFVLTAVVLLSLASAASAADERYYAGHMLGSKKSKVGIFASGNRVRQGFFTGRSHCTEDGRRVKAGRASHEVSPRRRNPIEIDSGGWFKHVFRHVYGSRDNVIVKTKFGGRLSPSLASGFAKSRLSIRESGKHKVCETKRLRFRVRRVSRRGYERRIERAGHEPAR